MLERRMTGPLHMARESPGGGAGRVVRRVMVRKVDRQVIWWSLEMGTTGLEKSLNVAWDMVCCGLWGSPAFVMGVQTLLPAPHIQLLHCRTRCKELAFCVFWGLVFPLDHASFGALPHVSVHLLCAVGTLPSRNVGVSRAVSEKLGSGR